MTTALSLKDLADRPPWPRDRVYALAGGCRGALLRDWSGHVRREWGAGADLQVRRALDLDRAALPDSPARSQVFPVAFQILVTREIADRFLGGDMLALEPFLVDAGRSVRDRVVQWAVRRIGPRHVLRRAERIHRYLYDQGRAEAEVGATDAVIRFTGAPLFDNPTWRLLQCFGARAMVTLLGKDVVELGAAEGGPGEFELRVAWSPR